MPNPIRRISLRNFKGFRNYSVTLGATNLLVGPNNAGKSTIISVFRILELGLRKARSRKPERIVLSDHVVHGYSIDLDELDVSTENVHTDYDDVDSEVSFYTESGGELKLIFPRNGGCFMTAEAPGVAIASPKSFLQSFPIPLVVVPVLAPLEHDEDLVTPATVQRNLGTSRASRNFRSSWVYYPDGFPRFASLVEQTWQHMTVRKPEHDERKVQMFCLERRMTRELYWAGFGFQIWCQLIAYVSRAEEGSLIIVDEPEVYLHPDVQRQILPLLASLRLYSVMATHSTEIIGQADPKHIVAINKRERSSKRLRDFDEVQLILDEIGSAQNLSLSRLARYKKVIFFEGLDLKVIKKLAGKLGVVLPDIGGRTSVIKSGGFSSWKRVRDFMWGAERLGLNLQVAAIYDRDFFTDAVVDELSEGLRERGCSVHVHSRKEIENYLLVGPAIATAVKRQCAKARKVTPQDLDFKAMIFECCEEVKDQVFTQRFSKKLDSDGIGKLDLGSVLKQELEAFGKSWADLEWRLKVVPGKQVLKLLRQKVQESVGVSISDSSIVDALLPSDIPEDIRELSVMLDTFLQGTALGDF